MPGNELYLQAHVPLRRTLSLENPGRTVLDDIVDFNKDEPIHSEARAFVRQGHIVSDIHDFKVSKSDMADLMRLFETPESEFEDVSIEQYFKPSFLESNLWLCFSSMLAFKPRHSVLEAMRYWQRFALGVRIEYLEGIVHTKYDEYDAIIKPVEVWLEKKGVNISRGTKVLDIAMDKGMNTVQSLAVRRNERDELIAVAAQDCVFFTNGSMIQNTRYGDNKTVALLDRSTADLGVFDLWRKLADKDPKFGRPAKFLKDIDKMTFISYFPTIKDSSWFMSFILHHKPFFPEQSEDVEVFWGNGLYPDRVGDYVKKPMLQCTGEEILTELLYHLGLLDMREELLKHTYVSVAAMPYIMSQFTPRKVSDRPRIVPEGCTNLAFIGQFVEVPGDVVFTVETSVRTALEAVYSLAKLDKEIIEVIPVRYDIRYNISRFKKFSNIKGEITERDLPKIKLHELPGLKKKLVKMLNGYPDFDSLYTGCDRSVPRKVSVLNPKAPLDTAR